MNNLNIIFEKIKEVSPFEKWIEGYRECFVFNDGAIVIEILKDNEINIKVISGECKRIDFNLGLNGDKHI